MPTLTIEVPTDCASAIRTVCYLRAWSMRQLAEAMGLKDGTSLSKILRHRVTGTEEMRMRVMVHMPEVANV